MAGADLGGPHADSASGPSAREARLDEVQNSFSGPTGGIRIIDAASGPKGTFRLALNTEFFIISDFFVPTDEAHHFAGNLSLSITPTEYLEVFAAAEVTSAWDDSNDPMLIQRVADVLLGLKGFYQAKPWVAVGGDASVAFLGGVGDGKATLRATSFGFRGNVTLAFRAYEGRKIPLLARFNAQYWFDNSAKLTEGIENGRYDALGGVVPRPLETRHLLTPFERFAYGVDRAVDPNVGGVALGRAGEKGHRLPERDAPLGHADPLDGQIRRSGDLQRLGVRVADVFGCEDDQSPRDE